MIYCHHVLEARQQLHGFLGCSQGKPETPLDQMSDKTENLTMITKAMETIREYFKLFYDDD